MFVFYIMLDIHRLEIISSNSLTESTHMHQISLNAFQICCSGRLSVHTQKIYVSKVLQLDILCGKSLIHGTSSSHQREYNLKKNIHSIAYDWLWNVGSFPILFPVEFITAQNVSCLRLACILLQNNLSLYSKLVGEEKDLSVNLISGVTAYFEHLEEKYGQPKFVTFFMIWSSVFYANHRLSLCGLIELWYFLWKRNGTF